MVGTAEANSSERERGRWFSGQSRLELASPMMKELEVAARSLHVELQPAEADKRGGMPTSVRATLVRAAVGVGFDWATRGQADALVVLPHFAVEENAGYVAELALKRRIPSIFWRTDFAEAGRFSGLWGE